VDGTWRLPAGELTLKQEFQVISGTLASGASRTAINGKLVGDHIHFTAGSTEYDGRVNGAAMSGTTKSGTRNGSWSATRVQQ
jgi:hypothetical protein